MLHYAAVFFVIAVIAAIFTSRPPSIPLIRRAASGPLNSGIRTSIQMKCGRHCSNASTPRKPLAATRT